MSRFDSIASWKQISDKALDDLEGSLRYRLDTQNDSEAKDELSQLSFCRQELENFVLLSLWAVFEESLNTWLAQRTHWAGATDDLKIRKGLLRRVQLWGISEKIDVIKPLIGAQIATDLNKLRQWRDWVAHRKNEPRPAAIGIYEAESLFSVVITILDKHPVHSMAALQGDEAS